MSDYFFYFLSMKASTLYKPSQAMRNWYKLQCLKLKWISQCRDVHCHLTVWHCTVGFSSSKSGTLNPALNGIYFLICHMDHYQLLAKPGSRPDLGLVQIWLRSVGRIKRYSQLSAGLSVPDLLLEKTTVHCPTVQWNFRNIYLYNCWM